MKKANLLRGENQVAGLENRECRLAEIRRMLSDSMLASTFKLIHALFDAEVDEMCGEAYSRKGSSFYHRGGSERRASVYLNGQRVPVIRPRVRKNGKDVALESYGALQDFDVLSESVKQKLIRGVSTRNYEEVLNDIEAGLGLKRTSVSRAFVRASQKDLDQINGRDLSIHEWVAIFVDGINFCDILLIVALGVTRQGKKILLGIREGSTENETLCLELLHSIDERGFKFEDWRILSVLDGGKGLHAAVRKIWAENAVIQRCIQHKERNVLEKLPPSYHAEARRRLRAAWNLNEYESAKAELKKVERWLESISEAAAASLREGFEETLTAHKLGLSAVLRRTFATTNPIESVFSMVRAMTGRVKNWRKGKAQVSRWAASALAFAEKKLRRIRGYSAIETLIAALTLKKKNEAEVAKSNGAL